MKTKDKTIYWSRQCSFTQEGMNEGWIDEDNITYFNYIDDILEIGYNHYNIYYTEWEDEDDLQYKETNGIITEL